MPGSIKKIPGNPVPIPAPAPAPAPAPNTAANIRVALEASGLAGNLTPEDLQMLKRLNQIAKSTGLSLEQKTSEASQLLKNNSNMSRLLLKLRTGTGKSVGPKGDQEEGGPVSGGVSVSGGGPVSGGRMQYPGPAQQFSCGQSRGHKLSGITGGKILDKYFY